LVQPGHLVHKVPKVLPDLRALEDSLVLLDLLAVLVPQASLVRKDLLVHMVLLVAKVNEDHPEILDRLDQQVRQELLEQQDSQDHLEQQDLVVTVDSKAPQASRELLETRVQPVKEVRLVLVVLPDLRVERVSPEYLEQLDHLDFPAQLDSPVCKESKVPLVLLALQDRLDRLVTRVVLEQLELQDNRAPLEFLARKVTPDLQALKEHREQPDSLARPARKVHLAQQDLLEQLDLKVVRVKKESSEIPVHQAVLAVLDNPV